MHRSSPRRSPPSFSSGGLVWKTHAFASPSVHARQNAKKRRLAAEDVRLTLRKAAAKEAAELQLPQAAHAS